MTGIPSIENRDLRGVRVVVRADLNVPIKDDRVSDATRIEKFAPTLDCIAKRGGSPIVMTHIGRPPYKDGKPSSTRLLVDALAKATGREIVFIPDCRGDEALGIARAVPQGSIGLMENVRLHPGEMANDDAFARELAQFGDIYVNDAFSCAHRAHASTAAITHHLPSFAGPSLLREVAALASVLDTPAQPVAGLIGGAKISTKIGVIENLISKLDFLIIGGGMANTFLKAMGRDVGKSLVEDDCLETAKAILADAGRANCEIVLPIDAVCAHALENGARSWITPVSRIAQDAMILDIGPETTRHLSDLLARCRTLLWNGPLGAFEFNPFGEGTFNLARNVAELTKSGRLNTVAGGGDTVAALNAAGVTEQFSYVSTAGGAFLEWLEGKELPAISILKTSNSRKMEVR